MRELSQLRRRRSRTPLLRRPSLHPRHVFGQCRTTRMKLRFLLAVWLAPETSLRPICLRNKRRLADRGLRFQAVHRQGAFEFDSALCHAARPPIMPNRVICDRTAAAFGDRPLNIRTRPHLGDRQLFVDSPKKHNEYAETSIDSGICNDSSIAILGRGDTGFTFDGQRRDNHLETRFPRVNLLICPNDFVSIFIGFLCSTCCQQFSRTIPMSLDLPRLPDVGLMECLRPSSIRSRATDRASSSLPACTYRKFRLSMHHTIDLEIVAVHFPISCKCFDVQSD